MSTTTTTTTATSFGHGYVSAVADYLGPDWTHRPQEGEERFLDIAYIGADVLLKDASVSACLLVDRGPRTSWYARMNYTADNTSHSLVDRLPYEQRQKWNGTITVAATKTAAQAAAELQRRLLQKYLVAYSYAMNALAEEQEQDRQDDALAQELAQGLRCRVERRSGRPKLFHSTTGGMRLEHGHVYCDRPMHLNPAQARDLCALIAQWDREGS